MPRIFGRLFGTGAKLAQARAAELRADLAQAAVLFAQAGRLDESARVMILRGEAEADPAARLRHYVQAIATAPAGSTVHAHALRKRASTILAMAEDGPMTTSLRNDLVQAARGLEAVGDHAQAAEAYARAGDVDGQVAALARAGEVDRLDAVLAEENARDLDRIARRRAHDEVAVLVASGRRREAAAMARDSSDEGVRERGRALERRRVAGGTVHLTLRGAKLGVVLGDEVVIGRAQSNLVVASSAVSRRHLAVIRKGGTVLVRDLGSRNGTTLRGLALAGEAAVAEGVELRLGGEVPLVVRPTAELPGAVSIDIAGARWIAPLGPALLGVGRWRLERGVDDWVELTTEDEPPAFAGALRLTSRLTLLVGDAIATDRGGTPLLEVGSGDR
jgi:hypothetical protein